jgi:hypothetical protein
MAAASYNISLEIGRDFTIARNMVSSDTGNALNCIGWTICFTIKNLITDLDSAAIYKALTPTWSSLSFGQWSFTITHGVTATFSPSTSAVYDISAADANGNLSTLLTGTCTIIQPVTRIVN